jgi:DNA-3-methyladenine glycosylase II
MTDVTVVHRTLLPATAPYSFELSLRAMAGFAPCASDHQVIAGRVRKAFRSADDAVVVEISPAGPGVELTMYAAEPPDADKLALLETDVTRWLSLDDDMSGFLVAAESDPAMAPLLHAAHGLHQVRFASLAEGAVYFALTQRSTQWFATARKRRLAADHGPGLEVDGVRHVAFPSLATVAALTDDELLRYAGNGQRLRRVREVVEGLLPLDEEWLRTGAYEEVRRALLAVPGIGAFTAHGLLLRVLGRPDDAPLDMAQFEAAATAVYGDPPPSGAELRERYGRWVGWWAYTARTARSWLPEPAPV